MRLFIAINFDDHTRSRLVALQDELCSCSERGGFVSPENLHLTLVFLGECNDLQTENIKRIMDETSFESFSMQFEKLGRFKRDYGDIWWVGVRENPTLLDLQRSLSDKLIRAGFSLDKKKYTPHITLARKVVTTMAPRQTEVFEQTVSRIDLMKSERINGVLTYTSIH